MLLQRAFAVSYWSLRTKVCGAMEGPLHLFYYIWLLLRYASLFSSQVDWSAYCRWCGDGYDRPYMLFDASSEIPNCHARMKVQTSLERCACGLSIPTVCHPVLRVPGQKWLRVAKRWLISMLRGQDVRGSSWAKFYYARTRFVVVDPSP